MHSSQLSRPAGKASLHVKPVYIGSGDTNRIRRFHNCESLCQLVNNVKSRGFGRRRVRVDCSPVSALGNRRAIHRAGYRPCASATMSAQLSESGAQAARLAGLAHAPLWRVLRDGLLPLQEARSSAYGRLNGALRAFTADPASVDYAAVCSNCTEDLKLASEGVLALQAACRTRGGGGGGAGFGEVADACGALQMLEEQKMVAVVSVHAIKRSKKVGGMEGVLETLGREGGDGEPGDGERRETFDEKVVRFSKRLADIDEEIAEIVLAWREAVLEAEEEDSDAPVAVN